MNLDDLILAHLRELLKLEASAIKDLLAIYRQESKRLIYELSAMPDDTFRFQYLSQILAQLEAGIKQMEARISEKVVAEVRRSQAIGIRQASEQVAAIPKVGGIPSEAARAYEAAVSSYAPLVSHQALIALQDASRLSTRRWAEGQLADARGVLTKGILERKHSKQVARELAQVMGPKAKGWEIERIAKTEVWQAANTAHRVADMAVVEMHPAIRLNHTWIAKLDFKCSTGICPRLHHQKVAVGGVFTDEKTGATFPGPLAHPQCRCRVITTSLLSLYVPQED